MEDQAFIIEHVKRNRTVYQICLFIFRMFLAGILAIIFLRATGRIEGSFQFFDIILFGAFGFNTLYMKRLIEFSDTALNEIGKTGTYSEGTNIVIRMIIRDPARLRSLSILMFLMGILVEGCAGIILWTIRETAGPLEIIVGVSFILIGIPIFALAVTYMRDYSSLKKRPPGNSGNP